MTPALQEITIYRPDYAMVMGKGMTRVPYVNPESSSGDFQVTDSCERSAAVMGDDYVKLSFELLHQQVFEAFSFIWYDNQLFFLKETYRPTSKGAYFKYDMKFVSIANMLDKQVCFRYITVSGQSIQPEPEINMNGTLDDMASIVVDSIHGAASRLAGTSRPQLYYAYVLQRLTLADDTLQGTTLQTFSFSGQKIAETLTEIANAYETEWWISQEDIQTVKLHMCKCECGDAIIVSDEYKVNGNEYESRGLLSCEYTQEWGNIPQKIIAFGSDRNLTRNQALQDVNGNQMYVSYGKQLRLAPNTSYTVKDREGNSVTVRTDGIGALTNTGVTSGIESVVVRDDIYPRCHFRVLGVTVKGTDNPIFTITAGALKADGVTVMSYAEMVAEQLLPLQIAPNETLSISFESGYLNGKEFEVAYDYKEVNGVMEWALTIVPEQGDDNGVSLPFGNLAPKVGDQFAIFHMIMPQFYITRAQEELAQVAYDEMLGVQDTRPEIKCKSEPEFFANQRVILGQRMGVHSELFGNILLDTNGDIAEGSPSLFVSRVTQFTHSLTTPNDVELRLASSRVEGHLSEIEAAIADQTDDIRGLEQRTINLSRRGWHDAAEMRDMLNSLAAEFLLIGEQKNQFAFTSAIECVNGYVVADIDHFDHLHVSAGYIQHTQEPYIKYSNSGRWDINVTDITTDENSNSLDPTKAYYLYAICAAGATTATIVLTDDTTKASNTDYLLMGILSSEYEDENTKTSYRVFNRSNGFTRVAGGTITTEQIQDPTRSLIIDFSSNPPRIIARNNAEIVGNINFKLTPQQISDIVASMPPAEAIGEIGGENLFRAEDWADWEFRPSSFAHKLRSDDLQAGKYVMTGKVYSTYSGCKVLAQYSDGTTKEMYYDSSKSHLSTSATEDNLVTTGVGITLDLSFEMEKSGYVTIIPTSPSTSNYYRIALVEVMLQKGDRATAYQPWVNYLTKALQGQTSVAGGLLATSVILLRDGEEVTAGMSGVKDDNILVFGGGSYDEAVNAAASPTYDKGDGTPITSLVKKDGTGKIGIYKISEDKAIVDVPEQGRIVIDASKTSSGIYLTDDKFRIKTILSPRGIDSLEKDITIDTYTTEHSHIESADYDVDMEEFFVPAIPLVKVEKVKKCSFSFDLYIDVKEVPAGVNGLVKIMYSLDSHENQSTVLGESNYSFNSENIENGKLHISVNFDSSGAITNQTSRSVYMYIGVTQNYLSENSRATIENFVAQIKSSKIVKDGICIGNDGILCLEEENIFKVKNTGSGQQIIAKGLKGVSSSQAIANSGEVCSTDENFTIEFSNLLAMCANYGAILAFGGVLPPGEYNGQHYETFAEYVGIFLSKYKFMLTK